ncbi:MAG: PAS domain S-box protein [Candidatus Methanoperedens sp.]|nr:PAS domain S-box protein [Candidatus Methanoperedens sp.]
MRIKSKLISGFFIVSLLVGLVGYIGLYANNHVVTSFEKGEVHFGSILQASNEVSSYSKRAQGHTMLYLTLNNGTDKKKAIERVASLREQIAIMEGKIQNPEAIKILNDTKAKTNEMQSIIESLIKTHDSEMENGSFDIRNHETLIRNLDSVSSAIRQNGLDLVNIELGLEEELNKNAQQEAASLYNLIFILSGIALISSMVIGVVIDRSISNPIYKLKNAAINIRKGNLDTKIDISSNDEIGELSNEFNRMAQDLQNSNDELISSKKYIDNVITSMDNSLIIVSKDGIIQTINHAACSLLDYKETELIGQPINKVLVDGETLLDTSSVDKNYNSKNNLVHNTESTFISKGLQKIPIIFSASIIESKYGNTRDIICVAQDISERKHIENTLRKSEESFSKAEKIGHFGYWEWDIATNKLIWSDEVFKLYGLDPQKVIPTYEIVVNTLSDGTREWFNKAINDALNNNAPFEGEYSLIRPDGSIRYTHTIGEVIRDMNGRPISMFGVVQDISERKEAEKELLKFKLGIERSNEAIFMTNIDGQITYVNPAFEKTYGYSREESLGKKPNILKSGLIPPEAYKLFWETLLSKKVMSGELINKTKNGRFINVDGSANPILNNEGNIVGFLAIQRDITERKFADEQIKSSLKEKEVLLREIHHRVKNNMQIISSLLSHQMDNITDKNITEIFIDSQNRIISMSLVHEKLYHSRDLRNIDFGEYINDLGASLFQSYNIHPENIKLNINVNNIYLDIDHAIPTGLIINELITNSLKYAFPKDIKGEITIIFRSKGEILQLVVGDNGIGFPKDLDFRKTRSLGLHLVTILTENQLHGKIDMNSNKGTEFIIEFKSVKS